MHYITFIHHTSKHTLSLFCSKIEYRLRPSSHIFYSPFIKQIAWFFSSIYSPPVGITHFHRVSNNENVQSHIECDNTYSKIMSTSCDNGFSYFRWMVFVFGFLANHFLVIFFILIFCFRYYFAWYLYFICISIQSFKNEARNIVNMQNAFYKHVYTIQNHIQMGSLIWNFVSIAFWKIRTRH